MVKKIISVFVLFIAIIVLLGSMYIQKMDEQSIIIRLGKINDVVTTAGIKFKAPFIDSRYVFTKRIVPYDTPPVSVITRDKKTIVFDTVAFYNITEGDKFFVKFKTVDAAQRWLDDIIYSAVRNQAGQFTFDELIYEKRSAAMDKTIVSVNDAGSKFGLFVKDIQLKRTSLPENNEDAVYRSMAADRNQHAAQIEAEGEAKYREITSEADRDYTEKVSDANRQSEEIKGQADKKSQALIADTMNEAPGLYMHLKQLDFYKKVIPGTPIIVKADGVLAGLKGK
jgi:membrane protease subunit HflC